MIAAATLSENGCESSARSGLQEPFRGPRYAAGIRSGGSAVPDQPYQGTILVLRFFYTSDGELRCRVTNARTEEHWVVDDARAAVRLLTRLRPLRR